MTIIEIKTDQRIIRFCVALVLFLIILASVYYDPVNYKITDCAFKHITGLSCPGCGLTRSFHAGANLHIAQAFAWHLMGPFFLLGFVLLFLKYLFESVTGKTILVKLNRAVVKTVFLLIAITWAGFWISRMIYEML